MAEQAQDDDRTIYLIDGSGYIFRAYYAVKRLSRADGQATNAVFGFTNMLLKVIKTRQPKYLGIAFDLKAPTFRHKMYPAYKANRPPMPDDMRHQLPWIHEIVDAFHIPRLSLEGFEADDVLGTVAHAAKKEGYKVRIITGDKDLMQLVDDDILLIDDMRGGRNADKDPMVDREKVIEKFGVPPEKVIDILALAGDSSDNIPGVKGIGLKTAAMLVDLYGDMEGILRNAPNIKQNKRRENLIEFADDARMSMELVKIKCDVDVPYSLDDMKYDGPDKTQLRTLLETHDFKRLLNDPIVRGVKPGAIPARVNQPNKASSASPGQGDLFAAAEPAVKAEYFSLDRKKVVVVDDKQKLASIVVRLRSCKELGVAAIGEEGSGEQLLVGLGISLGDDDNVYFPVGHDASVGKGLDAKDFVAALGPILENPAVHVVIYDAKNVASLLGGAGISSLHYEGDPMLSSYLLDPDESHQISSIAKRVLEYDTLPLVDVVGKGKAKLPRSQTRIERMAQLVGEAADLARRLEKKLAPFVEERGMVSLYKEMELPLEEVLNRMELAGILIDSDKLKEMSERFEIDLEELEKKAYDAAGKTFNLGSPSQISEILFKELKLKVVKRTKTGPSTDSTVLEALKDAHALPGLILEHRILSKLKNTYLDVLPTLVHEKTGRVHTHFNQAVAATGRLSSDAPNLQNIPNRTPVGREIRDAFIAAPGHVLLSLDYSQIELRILADVSEDPVLLETFKNGEDVHARTASEIFGVALADVERDQRTAAKAINFGLLYGMGVVRLSRELGIKRNEAKAYLEKYFERYQGVQKWHQKARDDAYDTGEVRTLFGRLRRLPELSSSNRGEVARGERLATNTPIQGSAADLVKRAMIVVDRELRAKKSEARMLLQVHDELLIEVKKEEADETMALVRKAMEEAADLKVPLVVDGNYGRTWADAH
ncbi:MAG: DNA polymerase I [Deltaproteobacteria bacterium]|nr:DNA polymerase I [Deltaproteobacteria bacterium]